MSPRAIADRLAALCRQVDRAVAWKLEHEHQCEVRARHRDRQRRRRRRRGRPTFPYVMRGECATLGSDRCNFVVAP